VNEHTTFGTVEVSAHSPWLGRHHMLDRGDSVLVDQCDLRGVKLRFGFPDTPYPLCGKCRSPIRPLERVADHVVWLGEESEDWTPYCSEAVADGGLTDEQRVERMWHEPDRSLGSWCRSAAIRVHDEDGALTFHARTRAERIVVRLSQRPDGTTEVQTSRTPRRPHPLVARQ
jgi:hypothetical protein